MGSFLICVCMHTHVPAMAHSAPVEVRSQLLTAILLWLGRPCSTWVLLSLLPISLREFWATDGHYSTQLFTWILGIQLTQTCVARTLTCSAIFPARFFKVAGKKIKSES